MKIFSIHLNRKEYFIFSFIFFVSFLIFLYYLDANASVNYYDESGYVTDSNFLLTTGHLYFPKTTYLYPSILSFFQILSNGDIVNTKIFMSFFQYSIYLFTIIFIANTFSNNKKFIWYAIISFGFLNPYLIQATTLFLTDLLPSCLIAISIMSLMSLNMNKTRIIVGSLALLYLAVMIRPSSIIFLPIAIGLIIFRFVKFKDIKILKILLISVLMTVIFIPQVYQNAVNYNEWNPLIHRDLYSDQSIWSVHFLKYGTVTIRGELPALYYYSHVLFEGPLTEIEQIKSTSIFDLFFKDPFSFFYVYFSHIFGVIDWGYVDTYIKEFYPTSRLVGSFFLYSVWFFTFYGILHLIWNKSLTKNNFMFASLLISAFVYTLFIATTAVESRFGYPIFLLLLPFSGYGINQIYKINQGQNNHKEKLFRNRVIFVITFTLFISVFFYLSFLLDFQTGRINWFNLF